jgi:hypothetical protein
MSGPANGMRRRHFALVATSAGMTVLAGQWPPSAAAATSLPGVGRTVPVETSEQLKVALSAAVPGDHIVLANGTYTGPGNFDRDGSSANPIVVRSANLLGATITATSLHPRGAHQILHGIRFTSPTMMIGNGREARNTKLWRCRFVGNGAATTAIFVRTYNSKDLDVAYCEWTNHAGRGLSIIPEAGTLRTTVRRCLFHNQPLARQNATEAIQLSFADRASLRSLTNSGIVIEACRFHNWNNDDEVISVKTSGVLLKQLSIENCNGNVNIRNGRFNTLEAVWIKNGRGITLTDGGNKALGCKIENTVSYTNQILDIRGGVVRAGDYPDSVSLGNMRNAAEDCVIAGCDIGTGIQVGGHRSSNPTYVHPVRNLRIRQTAGSISYLNGWHTGGDYQPGQTETLYAWAPLLWLTNSDVGPAA